MRPFFLPLFPERPGSEAFLFIILMKKHFITFLLLVGMTASLTAQQKYQPTEANLKARSEFPGQ